MPPLIQLFSLRGDCPALYVRKAYGQLYADVLRIFHGDACHNPAIPIVCGNPGIGKSRFILYLLVRAIQEGLFARIVLDAPAKFGEVMYLLETGRVTKISREATLCDVYIFDAGGDQQKLHVEHTGKTIVVSSPDIKSHRMATKVGNEYTFLPPFTLDELQELAGHRYYDSLRNKVPERFAVYGGIARSVLNHPDKSIAEVHNEVRRLIMRCDPNSLLSLLGEDAVFNRAKESHTLMQLYPPSEGTKPDIRLSSPFVASCVKERLLQSDKKARDDFLRTTAGVPAMASVRGVVFEAMLRSTFASGGHFAVRPLETGGSQVLEHFPAMRHVTFQGTTAQDLKNAVDSITMDGVTCHWPNASNFESIDAVVQSREHGVSTYQLFQITVSEHHPVKAKMVDELVDVLGIPRDTVLRLYLIVPQDIFSKFKAQPYHTREKTVYVAPLPWIAKGVTVEQWALMVDVDGLVVLRV